eukprot:scaffold1157_cov122-Cylindrotheca_fusiformis.AAC.25
MVKKKRKNKAPLTLESLDSDKDKPQSMTFSETPTPNVASPDGNEAYRSFMDKMAKSNVDQYVDLPMIAVMGDTSSGKSSLLSMISQVELPSNDKLTTRCPIMLQMRKTETISANVKVNWKVKPEGSNVDFPGKIVGSHNWHELTGYIAEAQEHIVTKQNKEVARDVVSVEMTGPHCENLTLIDLPGIVRSHGKGESASLSADIQSLLTDYLQNPRCVILAVLPANVDFHNSQIMAEALKVDPETKRTIPVLTKPDLIDTGAEGSVMELLLGYKTQDFEMGFHMVKGRGQDALNKKMSIEEGLAEESSFFYNTEPWRNVENKSLFGTKNLRVKLGELQMSLIRTSFNDIVAEIKTKRDEAVLGRSRLGDIPTEFLAKRALFRSVKDEFYKTIGPLVLEGHVLLGKDSGYKMKPSAEFHQACDQLKTTLESSRLANVSDVAVGVDVIVFLDGKEYKGKVAYVKNCNAYLKTITDGDAWDKADRGKEEGEVFEENSDILMIFDSSKCIKLRPIPLDKIRRDPEWIKKLIEENRPYELPIFINTSVFNGIVWNLVREDWREPSLRLLDHTAGLMEMAADKYIKTIEEIESLEHFRHFLMSKSSELVEDLKETAKAKVLALVDRERKPYTQNHYLFENLAKLQSKRLMDELITMLGSDEEGNMERSAVISIVKNVFERNQGSSMDDHMAEAMQHALNAYGKVTLKRFIDVIPMICIEVMQDFPGRINDILSSVLDEEIEKLIVAPPEKVRAMKEYDRKIETLDKSIAAIKELY